ncbi:exported hypothetical protein [Bradyrhizobium sp. STM 3809]|nr:exported hypothetical protein [Bradyrhizobium sp. STM 3809]
MRSPICFMNLRSRAAALPSILPSAAIQLSHPGPQESGPPLTSANEIGAELSAIRGEAAGFLAGFASAAGLAVGLVVSLVAGLAAVAGWTGMAGLICMAGFCGAEGLTETTGLLIAGWVVGGTAASDAEPISAAVRPAAAMRLALRRIRRKSGAPPKDTIATRPHAQNT